MRPIVNMPEEDRATDIGNIHKKNLAKIARVVQRYPRGQTDTQTYILITILRNRSRGRSKNHATYGDALEARQPSHIPEQFAHFRVVVRKVFNAASPAYNKFTYAAENLYVS